jgi:hypothetical protein
MGTIIATSADPIADRQLDIVLESAVGVQSRFSISAGGLPISAFVQVVVPSYRARLATRQVAEIDPDELGGAATDRSRPACRRRRFACRPGWRLDEFRPVVFTLPTALLTGQASIGSAGSAAAEPLSPEPQLAGHRRRPARSPLASGCGSVRRPQVSCGSGWGRRSKTILHHASQSGWASPALGDAERQEDLPEDYLAIAVLHERGTREVLDAALASCSSPAPKRRALSANILGQLGSPERTFGEVCCDALLLDLVRHGSDPTGLDRGALCPRPSGPSTLRAGPHRPQG